MSWFDAAGLANIAKSALKGAQRTIDKALDIKDDEGNAAVPATALPLEPDDFFGSWGLHEPREGDDVVPATKPDASLWGSFTGSFFDQSHAPRDHAEASAPNLRPGNQLLRAHDEGHFAPEQEDEVLLRKFENVKLDLTAESAPTQPNQNRLSVISNESGRNSSESVEIIGDGASGATSPDSEPPSASIHSSNPSSKGQSVSVALTNTSSLEILSRATLDLATPTDSTDDFISPVADECADAIRYAAAAMRDNDDDDDDSISYVSLSESTAATILEPIAPKYHEPITRGPSRANMLLSFAPSSSCSSSSTNVIDIPREEDEGFQSDRTLIASDNPMDSSNESAAAADSSSTTTTTTMLLADAMCDAQAQRDASPASSDGLVKIDGSAETTSCDEAETATSSDIEIISSPNGDSSSTQSRHSPTTGVAVGGSRGQRGGATEANVDALLGRMTFKRAKGHNRELSETSSISDDSHASEVERLIRRIGEVTEILESREAKLIDTNRRNVELQEINNSLRAQLDSVLNQQLHTANMTQIADDYTQRLSALEAKFQQAIRDKDQLRKQLEQSRVEGAGRVNRAELDALVGEKETIIAELRHEGEKLSKEQLHHSNIIKKLRAKEKEHESAIKKLRETVEDLTSETERLKRSLVAKEEVERTQIEAVHQLTFRNKKLDQEVTQWKSQCDDIEQKYETCKRSLEAAKKDVLERNRATVELQMHEQRLQTMEMEKRMTESQNEQMLGELEGLRERLRSSDQGVEQREHALRADNARLLRMLEEAKRANEELAQNVMEVSRPLIRQLEALQATYNAKTTSFEKTERTLSLKISELQSRADIAANAEQMTKQECLNLMAKVSDLEGEIGDLNRELDVARMALEEEKTAKMVLKHELDRKISELQLRLDKECATHETLKRDMIGVQQQLDEKSAALAEKTRRTSTQQNESRMSPCTSTHNTSPTFSITPLSRSESLNSSTWPAVEDISDSTYLASGLLRSPNMLELQLLQTNLKQREGEVHQLQWELNRREQEKTLLNNHIAQLSVQTDELAATRKQLTTLTGQFDELQRQYETLLQLYGEKVEEVEELKLDLQDVKDLYKEQVDEFVKQKAIEQQKHD